MAYKYERSENFRANIYLLAGIACFSPLGIFLSKLINHELDFDILSSTIVFISSIIGVSFISKSYIIMLKKNEFSNYE
jgi:hypothetical protein